MAGMTRGHKSTNDDISTELPPDFGGGVEHRVLGMWHLVGHAGVYLLLTCPCLLTMRMKTVLEGLLWVEGCKVSRVALNRVDRIAESSITRVAESRAPRVE